MQCGRSLARVAATAGVALATLLAMPAGQSGRAYADGGPLVDPTEWAQFLGQHPELVGGTGASTAVAACEAVITCPAGLAVGTFALTVAGTSKVLTWAF